MTPEQFEQKLRQNREALKQAIRRTIPVKMGNAAERHFKDNFRKGGFVDGSLHRWKPSKRPRGTGKGCGLQQGGICRRTQRGYACGSYIRVGYYSEVESYDMYYVMEGSDFAIYYGTRDWKPEYQNTVYSRGTYYGDYVIIDGTTYYLE